MADIFARLKVRTGTNAAWTSANPILAAGEPGFESDTRVLRIGDGATAFLSLDQIKTTDGFEASFQPISDNVTSLAGLTLGANLLLYSTGIGALATASLAAKGRAFLAASTEAAQRTALQLGNAALLDTSRNTNFAVDVNLLAARGTIKTMVDATAAAAVTAGAPAVVPEAVAAIAEGAIGSYVFARSTGGDIAFGATVAGSILRPTSGARGVTGQGFSTATFNEGSALTGTWRCMGTFDQTVSQSDGSGGAMGMTGATLWLRIA